MTPRHSLLDNVEQQLRKLSLTDSGIVLALSGGHDSVALLLALLWLQANDVPILMAHLNHQIRAEESDADEQFVRELRSKLGAQGYNVQLVCERLDVPARARLDKDNLESTARRLRYDWLERIAREAGITVIATGHTADDQAETVLHRLLRGAGLQGLRGIALERSLESGARLVRPLLTTTRAEVLSFLDECRQSARMDSSNSDLNYTRNRIRLELLPHLVEQYNPGIRNTLCRLAEQAGEAHEEELRQGSELLAQVERPRAGTLVILDLTMLQSATRARIRAMLRLLWEREDWPRGQMSHEHWTRLVDVALQGEVASDFPGRIRARRRENVLQIGPIS